MTEQEFTEKHGIEVRLNRRTDGHGNNPHWVAFAGPSELCVMGDGPTPESALEDVETHLHLLQKSMEINHGG